MNYFKFAALCSGILFCSTGYSQTANRTPLTVHTVSAVNKPLGRVNVLLKLFANGRTVTTLLTDTTGKAILSLDTGKYILMATYTGLEPVADTFYIKDIRPIERTYTFRPQAVALEGVTVTARKKLLEARDDKFIYNVSADSMARSRSVSQVLGNLPFVMVDGMGNVKIAGQENFKVLVNGKETALFATSVAEALKSFPADAVVRIELNMAPGARFDAEGVTATINIITKKFQGFMGFAIVHASDRSHYSNGLTLTAKTGRLGITVNGDLNGTFNALNGYRSTVTTPFQPVTYKSRWVDGRESNKYMRGSSSIELSFEIDSLRSLVGYTSIGKRSGDNRLDQQVTTTLPTNVVDQGFIEMEGHNRTPSTTIGMDYSQRSKANPAKELVLRFNWQGSNNRINNGTTQQYGSFSKWMQNNSRARNDEFTLQADLVPVARKKITVETGAKAILRYASADYNSFLTYDLSKEYVRDSANSNGFNYRQQVYAVYGSAAIRAGKNSLRAGVRLEQTNINGAFSNLASAVTDHYLSVVPNLNFTRKTGKVSSLSFSYNMNLLRPYITSLNPYVNNVDSFNITYGNPSLGPQTIHKMVLQGRYNDEKLFFAASLTASWSNNKILSYRKFQPATGITENTVGNAGRERLLSVGLSGRYIFSEVFYLGLNGDLRYVDVRNKIQTGQKRSGYSGLVAGYFNWDINERFSISGSGGMSVDNVSLLGRYTPVNFYQVNTGYTFIKNKLSGTINWNNVHSAYITQKTIFSDDVVSAVTASKTVFRVIFFGIQYNFGKLKKEVTKKKGVQNDDILK
jgi:hypothetical protein